jgi:hypothetical protein
MAAPARSGDALMMCHPGYRCPVGNITRFLKNSSFLPICRTIGNDEDAARSVATLEDWFDPKRLEEGYVSTGWKRPPATTTRAVQGHEFGLDSSAEDKAALIAFLKTLCLSCP